MIRNVRPVDKALRDKGYKTTTTFEKDEDFQAFGKDIRRIQSIRKAAKRGFWMESGKIKLSTIQSYKGWGIHTEILIIGNDFQDASDEAKFLNAEMVYTGITRAKKNLIVINIGDKEYDEFFRSEMSGLSDMPKLTEAEKISPATQKFNEALKLYNSGDYNGAIELYTEAIALNPNFEVAYYNRGNAYALQQQYERAIQDYDKAIALNPNYTNAYYNRGLAYAMSGNLKQAILDATKVIEILPDYADAYQLRGLCYQELGETDKAEADFAKARELGYTE